MQLCKVGCWVSTCSFKGTLIRWGLMQRNFARSTSARVLLPDVHRSRYTSSNNPAAAAATGGNVAFYSINTEWRSKDQSQLHSNDVTDSIFRSIRQIQSETEICPKFLGVKLRTLMLKTKALEWNESMAAPFEGLLNHLLDKVESLSQDHLASLLRLYLFFPPADFPSIQRIKAHVLESLHTFNAHTLANVVWVYAKTGHQEELYRHSDHFLRCIRGLCDTKDPNFDATASPRDLLRMLFFVWKMRSSKGEGVDEAKRREVVRLLHDKLALLCPQMTTSQLLSVMEMLVKEQTRHWPLMGAVADALTAPGLDRSTIRLRDCETLLSNCITLSYNNPVLLQHLCDIVSAGLSNAKKLQNWTLLAKVLRELSLSKFNHRVTHQITNYLLRPNSECYSAPAKLCDVLKAAAVLALVQSSVPVDRVMRTVYQVRDSQPDLWLSAVLSAAVLKRLRAEWAESVLSSDFIVKLHAQTREGDLAEVSRKLALINAAAGCDIADYSGPRLSQQQVDDFSIQTFGKDKLLATQKLHSIILGIVPISHVKKTSHTSTGHMIDFEMLVRRDASDYQFLQLPQPGELLPQNSQRLVVQLVPFSHTLHYHPHRVGVELMKRRHLQHQGYTVVEVEASEVLRKRRQVQHVQFFSHMVKKALGLRTTEKEGDGSSTTTSATSDSDVAAAAAQTTTLASLSTSNLDVEDGEDKITLGGGGQLPKTDLAVVIKKLGKTAL